MSRIDVNKTYKLFIGGAFPRSESGRVYEIKGANKKFIANPALASRKDLRDAVVAAKAAHSGWANALHLIADKSCIALLKLCRDEVINLLMRSVL